MSIVDEVLEKVLESSKHKKEVSQEELKQKVEKHFDGKHFRAWCQTCDTVFINIDYNQYLRLHSWDNNKPDKWFVLMFKHYVQNQEHIIIHSVPAVGWTNFTPDCKRWYERQKSNLGSDVVILKEIDRYVKNCNTKI